MYTPAQAFQPGEKLDSTTALLVAMKEKGTLQSYVAQHRDSPEYPMLLSLAATINKVSDATRAAQNRPPQQTVADQQLAALAPAPAPAPMPAPAGAPGPQGLPENSGIGQLPAPNLQAIHKASGGIIAFEEGGHVPRYNGNTSDGSKVASSPFGDLMSSAGSWFSQVGDPATNPRAQLSVLQAEKAKAEQGFFEALTPQQKAERRAQVQQIDSKIKEVQSSLSRPAATKATATMPSSTYSNPGMQNDPRLVGTSTFAEQTAPSLNQQKLDAAAEEEGLTDKSGKTRYAPPGAPAATGIDALMTSAQKYFPKGEAAPSDREGFMKEREAVRAPIYEKMDKMIEEEKGKLKGDREQAFFMSMIEGGLAAAGGSSQYGLQNIAQGFAKGAAGFGEALKDIRKAAKENAKMEVDAQRMRSADKINDMDSFQRSEESYKQRQATRDAAMTSGVFALTGDKLRADAAERTARITAGGQSSIARELGGGDLRKGMEILTSIQSGKRTLAQSYEDYMKAWAGKDTTMGQPLTPQQYVQQIKQLQLAASAAPTASNKATGKVFD